MSIQTKICGITGEEDAEFAVSSGADYVGFVLFPKSPRYVTVERACELIAVVAGRARTVGVFVNASSDEVCSAVARCGLDIVQLHGTEPAAMALALGVDRVWKALPVQTPEDVARAAGFPAAAIVVDSMAPGAWGGTGKTGNWALAAELSAQRRIMLAGGLSPDNVAAAIVQVQPYGVDVSSGVESAPGRKDHERVQAFVQAVRGAAS